MNALEKTLHDHLPKIRRVAWEVHRLVSNILDMSALIQAGITGLWEASLRFDPSRGSSLWQWGYHRVRGAMLDEIRRYDPVSRYHRQRLKTEDYDALGFETPHHCSLEAAAHVPAADNPEESCHTALRARVVTSAMKQLRPPDRELLWRLYYEGQVMTDVGRDWDLTEGRICQLKKRALERLKAHMEYALDVDVAEL